ncbi:Uncharacterized protein FKW44_014932, partial [Caligus rogercresseyi]
MALQFRSVLGGLRALQRHRVSSRSLYDHPIFGPPLISPEEAPHIQYSPYEDVPLPKEHYTEYVWANFESYKDREAIVCGMTGRSYTYEMLQSLSQKFGSALVRSGAKKGDVLGLVVPNIPEFVIAFMGAASVGVTLTTMNPTYRPEEIARQLENSGSRYVMTIGLFLQNIKQACEIYKGIESIIVIGMEDTPPDCTSFMQMAIFDDGSFYEKREDIQADKDILVLPYSSGTTGPPKGVALTHSCIVSNMAQVSHPKILSFGMGKKDL